MCWGCVVGPLVGGSLGNVIQGWAITWAQEIENTKEKRTSTYQAKQAVAKILRVVGNVLTACAWKKERPLSVKLSAMAATGILTATTFTIIKSVFHISFCGANGFSFGRAAAILAGSTLIGTIYSLGISALLNRYVPLGSSQKPSCCCRT